SWDDRTLISSDSCARSPRCFAASRVATEKATRACHDSGTALSRNGPTPALGTVGTGGAGSGTWSGRLDDLMHEVSQDRVPGTGSSAPANRTPSTNCSTDQARC